MAAPARLGVATTCPSCAAPLDLLEGASSVHCGHCGTRLLLPGRRRVLTYWVRPRGDARSALELARSAAPGARDPELWLLPYYRYTAEALGWEWPPIPPGREHDPDLLRTPELVEHAVERNFLACAWDGLGLYSMGVRTTALRLELLRTDALPEGARVVAPETTSDAALAHALRMTNPELVAHRAVLCGVLSLVYFPFWIVPLGAADACRFAIVDGVTNRLVSADGPPVLRARLANPSAPIATPIAPRPLVCPNCGWDLPDDPDHVIFFCAQCARAWALVESRLEPISHDVVAPPPSCHSPIAHEPIWMVDAPDAPPALRRIAVPAFRHRTLRLVLALATTLTRSAVEPRPSESPPVDATGAYLDWDDARALARMIAIGVDSQRAAALTFAEPRLVWWPFERLAGSIREPYTMFALPAGPIPPAAAARAATST